MSGFLWNIASVTAGFTRCDTVSIILPKYIDAYKSTASGAMKKHWVIFFVIVAVALSTVATVMLRKKATQEPAASDDLPAVIPSVLGATMEGQLAGVMQKINATLPQMVDEQTRLDTTASGPGASFTYFYTLVNYASTQGNRQKIQEAIASLIKQRACASAKKNLLRSGVTMHYVYRTNDSMELTRFSIAPEDCVSPS